MIFYDKTIDTISTGKLIALNEEMVANVAKMFLVSAAETSVDMLRDDNHEEYSTKEDMDNYLRCLQAIAGDMIRDFCNDFQDSLLSYIGKANVKPMITNLKYDVEGRLKDITVHLLVQKPQA